MIFTSSPISKRFLWSSERTGFRHYYLYDLSGKQLEQLTSGDWGITGTSGFGPGAVNHPAVDEAHGYDLFSIEQRRRARYAALPAFASRQEHHAHHAGARHARCDHRAGRLRFCGHLLERDDPAAPGPLPARWNARDRVINENKVPELAEYHLSPARISNCLRRKTAPSFMP